MNHLWLDVETTGLSEHKCDIIQLACIPVINGIPQKSFNEFCQPQNYNTIEQAALNVHGITIDRMRTFQSQEQLLKKFIEYTNSFGVRFTISGFNVSFDKKHISATFSKHKKSSDFFRMFTINIHDTYSRAKSVKSQIPSDSLKLEALANLYKIPIVAHDALSDISATIEVDKKIAELMGEDIASYAPILSSKDISIVGSFPEMVQLHVHSQYNMADGVPLPEEWYKWAETNNVPGISIVDQGSGISLFDCIRNEKNTVAIPGVGLNIKHHVDSHYSINAWAISNQGYNNLVKLSSLGFDNAEEINGVSTPLLFIEDLASHKEGLVFGTADVNGLIGKAILSGDKQLAEENYLMLKEKLGDIILEMNPCNIL